MKKDSNATLLNKGVPDEAVVERRLDQKHENT